MFSGVLDETIPATMGVLVRGPPPDAYLFIVSIIFDTYYVLSGGGAITSANLKLESACGALHPRERIACELPHGHICMHRFLAPDGTEHRWSAASLPHEHGDRCDICPVLDCRFRKEPCVLPRSG